MILLRGPQGPGSTIETTPRTLEAGQAASQKLAPAFDVARAALVGTAVVDRGRASRRNRWMAATQGERGRNPWEAKRCPDNVDPDPADTSANACLTDGQISTLEFTYSRYAFATPLAHGTRTFGMWVPNTDPSGSGLIVPARFRGQEGAAADAPMHTHLGGRGVGS